MLVNDNPFLMLLVALAGLSPLKALAADETCQSFSLQGDEFVVEPSSSSLKTGSLATIVDGLEEGELLSVHFSSSEICIAISGVELAETNATRYVINLQAQELALLANISGSADVWLRLSPGYQSELLLDRVMGEEVGLTDMEFLSDNSGVGAEDFFAEQIEYLELGAETIDAPFAEVPRFGVEYAHYDPSVNQALPGFVATQGILGLDSLRDLTLTFSPSQGLVLFAR